MSHVSELPSHLGEGGREGGREREREGGRENERSKKKGMGE